MQLTAGIGQVVAIFANCSLVIITSSRNRLAPYRAVCHLGAVFLAVMPPRDGWVELRRSGQRYQAAGNRAVALCGGVVLETMMPPKSSLRPTAMQLVVEATQETPLSSDTRLGSVRFAQFVPLVVSKSSPGGVVE